MRPLSADDILTVWEQSQGQHLIDRALTLLTHASSGSTRGELAALCAGQRDALLLDLRERTFGTRLEVRCECPACGEALELTMATTDLRSPARAVFPEPQLLRLDGLSVQFRLPSSADLLAITRCRDEASALRALLRRCVLSALLGEQALDPAELDGAVVDQLAARMAEEDAQADARLALCCPACRRDSQVLFDIVSFFLTELGAQAERLLGEVHALARAYGWHEQDILAMSARRRQRYLELLGS